VTTALVAGAVANKAGNGGAAWTRLSWTLGLARLGFDVHFVEELAPRAPDQAIDWFQEVMGDAGLTARCTLLHADGSTATGRTIGELEELAAESPLLLNISGHLRREEIVKRPTRRVYIDLDPGYTQLWHADGTAPLQPHDHWYTVGALVGTAACPLPTAGLEWHPINQPVVLDQWQVQEPVSCDRFTTVASWRGPYGPVLLGNETLGSKVHEFRRFVELPTQVDATFELCLDIHPGDDADRAELVRRGWRITHPATVASPERFRKYVQGSAAEFSVAQSVYTRATTGWFSDRSVRYLASGRPTVVQDTGFSQTLPVDEGILTFTTPDEARRAVTAACTEPDRHAKSARAIAEEHFDAVKVLGRLCEEVGVAP
jgi:hypothetical protein